MIKGKGKKSARGLMCGYIYLCHFSKNTFEPLWVNKYQSITIS